jgi:AraC-like DNA-binding protein
VAHPTTSTHGILGPAESRAFSLTRQRPADDLAPYVERHWVVRWSLRPGANFTQELLPHPCVNLVSAPDRVAVHGMPLERARRRLEGSGVAVGTKFRPGAFSAFVDMPARQLVDRSFELSELFGRDGSRLQRRLAARPPNPATDIPRLEAFLRSRLPPPDPRRQLLLEIVGDMLREHSSVNVAGLARRHGVSQRTLQRLFRDYIGVSPKWVLKRYRVHEAAERIASGEAPDAARLAADLGYYDQPHFVKDFTSQVGCSPHRYGQLCAAAAGPEAKLGHAA